MQMLSPGEFYPLRLAYESSCASVACYFKRRLDLPFPETGAVLLRRLACLLFKAHCVKVQRRITDPHS
jgi:hypothetical protein